MSFDKDLEICENFKESLWEFFAYADGSLQFPTW